MVSASACPMPRVPTAINAAPAVAIEKFFIVAIKCTPAKNYLLKMGRLLTAITKLSNQ
jgi:hypothetical protein